MSIIHASAQPKHRRSTMRPNPPLSCPRRHDQRRRRSGAFRRHPPRLHAGGRRAPVRLLPHPPHAGRDGRRPAVASAEDRAVRAHAGRADRQPGGAAGQGRAARRSICPAGRSRPTPTPAGEMYPDQSLYPVDSVPNVVRGINNALRRCRPDRPVRGRQGRHLLDGADRRRCRSRLRRPAERLRADARR